MTPFPVSIAQSSLRFMMQPVDTDRKVKEVLWQKLVNVQCRKLSKVVNITAEVLDEHGLEEEATQLRGWLVCQSYQVSDCFDSVIETYPITFFLTVLSELYQKGLISGYDLHRVHEYPFMMECSSRYWLDSLVDIQSSKSADVHARTFDTLRRLSKVVKERETKHTRRCDCTLFPLVCMCIYACAISVICNFVGARAAI